MILQQFVQKPCDQGFSITWTHSGNIEYGKLFVQLEASEEGPDTLELLG
jgi:hypothetical protein